MNKDKWIGYEELAWIEPIIVPPEQYYKETELYCRLIREHTLIESQDLLHFASGAGINDYTFKKYFDVTGVDLSRGMLKVAKEINPEVTYYHGDMRSIDLQREFDVVAIPDSIGYMTTAQDLQMVVGNACRHLRPGGVLLITAHLKEEFRANNFVYTGSRGDVEVTVFENNYIVGLAKDCYEATIIYLIRRKGELELFTECHTIGLFDSDHWQSLFDEYELKVCRMTLNDLYDPYIIGEGSYPITIFICLKQLR